MAGHGSPARVDVVWQGLVSLGDQKASANFVLNFFAEKIMISSDFSILYSKILIFPQFFRNVSL